MSDVEYANYVECTQPIRCAVDGRWRHVDHAPVKPWHRAAPNHEPTPPSVTYVCTTCDAAIERFVADVSGGVDWRHVEGEDEVTHLAWPNGRTVTVPHFEPTSKASDVTYGCFITKTTDVNDAFTTGSVRGDRTGKGRYDLLPREAVHRLAQLYERGATTYGDHNWELGQPFSRVIDSLLRHAFQAAAGMHDEDHLAAVMWNAAALIAFEERIAVGELPTDLNDLGRS